MELIHIINVVITIRVFYKDYEQNKYSNHAEKNAINKINNKNILKECSVVIIKIINNKVEQAYPCEMCKKLLLKYGIKKIINIDKIKQ